MGIKQLYRKSREKKEYVLFFAVLLIGYAALTFFLFYRQAIEYRGIYYSDMKAYILEAQGLNSGYEFPYPLFFWISGLFSFVCQPAAAVALVTMLFNAVSVILLRYYLNRECRNLVEKQGKVWHFGWDAAITLLVFGLFFVSMIYSPRGTTFFGFDYTYRCMGIYTPNPYWNATYLATRPFTIICFFQGIKVLASYEREFAWKDCLLFGIALFLTTVTKPSFTFIIVPVFGILMLYRLCRQHMRTWKNTFYMGCFILPTGLALLYQFFGIFSGQNALGEETGIGFAIGKAWKQYTNNIPLSIFMGLAFPLGVFVLNFKEWKKSPLYRFAWQLLLAGMLTFLCLYEKGFRFSHMNFSWGYMHGMFFVYVASVWMVIKNTLEWKNKSYRLLLIPEWGALLLHLICGINYYIYIMQGNNTGWF